MVDYALGEFAYSKRKKWENHHNAELKGVKGSRLMNSTTCVRGESCLRLSFQHVVASTVNTCTCDSHSSCNCTKSLNLMRHVI